MPRILEIGASVSTPLALAGFALAVLYLVYRLVLSKRLSEILPDHSYKLLSQIAFYVFILALVAIVLGMASILYQPGQTSGDPRTTALESEIRQHLDNAYYTTALNEAEELIRLRPDYAIAHKLKGHALFKLNRNEAALMAFESALSLDPHFSAAMFDKAAALMAMGRYSEARPLLEILRAQDATDLEARYNLVSLFLLTGDYQSAAQGYSELYPQLQGTDRGQAALGRGISELLLTYTSNRSDEKVIDGAIGRFRDALNLNPLLRGVFLGVLEEDERHSYREFIKLLKRIEMLEDEESGKKYLAFVTELKATS